MRTRRPSDRTSERPGAVSARPTGPPWRRSVSSHATAVSFGVGRAHDREVRDRAERREVLDRLVRRAVFAERDGVVRPDEDARDVHQRREADGRAHVVGELQERAADRTRLAVQHDAVEDRRHGVLADAEVHHASVRVARPSRGVDSVRLNESAPSIVVLLVPARSAEPPHNSGSSAARALITLPARGTRGDAGSGFERGQRFVDVLGKFVRFDTVESAFFSGFAAAQASNFCCHAARFSAAREARARVCAITSSSTRRSARGRSRAAFFVAAQLIGAERRAVDLARCSACRATGQPMIVLRMMSDGLSRFALRRSRSSRRAPARPRRTRRSSSSRPRAPASRTTRSDASTSSVNGDVRCRPRWRSGSSRRSR